MRIGHFFLFFLLCLSSWTFAQGNGSPVVPGSFVVQVQDDVDPGVAATAVSHLFGGRVGHVYNTAIKGFSIDLPPGLEGKDLLPFPWLKTVEPNLVMRTFAQVTPTGIQRIGTPGIDGVNEVMDVDIAIIDTGIATHDDLTISGGVRFYSIYTGPPKSRGTFMDSNYTDDNGHGTHVAGIAAAKDNSLGVVGVAPGARLWAVKVLDSGGSGYLSDIIAGLNWVADRSGTIEVVNMSLGGQGVSSAYQAAIRGCVDKGIVVVVAAGNESRDVYGPDGTLGTSDDTVPAAYPEAMTISALADSDGQPGGLGPVTSYGPDDTFASFSNYSGSVSTNLVSSPGKAIDLILPGVAILSTVPGGYGTYSGTSMASPHGAGLVARYIAAHSRPTDAAGVYTVRQALINGGLTGQYTDDPDSNYENLGVAGEVSTEPLPPVAKAGPNQTVQLAQGETTVSVTLDGSASYDPDGGAIVSYAWSEGETLLGTGVSLPVDLTEGSHAITLMVTDEEGQTGSDAVVITVQAYQDVSFTAELTSTTSVVNKVKNFWTVTITVVVRDALGNPVPNATVYGMWSGLLAASTSGLTGSNGAVSFTTGTIKTPGSVTFTVDRMVKDGIEHELSGSIEISYP